jgi:hypothetical protein
MLRGQGCMLRHINREMRPVFFEMTGIFINQLTLRPLRLCGEILLLFFLRVLCVSAVK